jgi:hypothetical protein
VEKQRFHGNHPTTWRDAGDFAATVAERDMLGTWHATQAMGAGNDAKRAVVGVAVVDMEADSH